MDAYRFLVGRTIFELPWWWIDALLAWMGLIGLVLWLFGRHLIRPFFGIAGLVSGSMTGTFVALRFFPDMPAAPFVAGGAIVGAIIYWSMYRLGMGTVLAVTLAIVAPLATITVIGAPQPALGGPLSEAIAEIAKATSIPDSATTNDKGQTVLKPGSLPPPLSEPLEHAVSKVSTAWSDWWGSLTSSARTIVLAAVVIGAINGVVLGVMVPGLSSAFVASLLGVLLMAGGARRVAGSFLDSVTPSSPQGGLIVMAVFVVIGAVLQLTFFRKSSA